MAEQNASYTKTQQGDSFVFHVNPAPKVLGGCSGLLLVGSCALVVGMLTGAIFTPIIGVPAFFITGYLLLKKDMRTKNHQNSSTFEVSANQIRVNEQVFNKDDIHRLIIQNAYRNTPEILLTGDHSAGTGAGYDIRKANERISFSLEVEMGGRAHQLAGGMDDTTAFGLLTDVCRILDFKTNG